MLAGELSDYLFARSTGHIGSLMTLLNRGCQRAVRTGTECLTAELLDTVKCDAASEAARRELEAALASGRLTTKINSKRKSRHKAATNMTGKGKRTGGATRTASRTVT
jgi:hypothetical protein